MKINCTDFSGPATEATDHALELARLYGASTHLFHVIEDPIAYTPALEVTCHSRQRSSMSSVSTGCSRAGV